MEDILEHELLDSLIALTEKSLTDIVKYGLAEKVKKAKEGFDPEINKYMIVLSKYWTEGQRDQLEFTRTELIGDIENFREKLYDKLIEEQSSFTKQYGPRVIVCLGSLVGMAGMYAGAHSPATSLLIMTTSIIMGISLNQIFKITAKVKGVGIDLAAARFKQEVDNMNMADIIAKDEPYFKQKLAEYHAIR